MLTHQLIALLVRAGSTYLNQIALVEAVDQVIPSDLIQDATNATLLAKPALTTRIGVLPVSLASTSTQIKQLASLVL